MANMSTYLEEALLNHVFRNTAYTRPTIVYCGIATSTATDEHLEAGTLTNEVTAYDGDRKAITFGAPTQASTKGTIKNSAALEFDEMPASTVKYLIITDSATKSAGNILYWCPIVDGLGAPITKAVNAGDTLRVRVDELIVTLA